MTRCTHDKASNPPEVITSSSAGQSKAPVTRGLKLYPSPVANATRLRIWLASLDSKSVLECHPPWEIAMSTRFEQLVTVAYDDAMRERDANLDCSQRCKV